MSDLKRLEKRIDNLSRKLEDFTDSYEELDTSVQSLFDSVNDLKTHMSPVSQGDEPFDDLNNPIYDESNEIMPPDSERLTISALINHHFSQEQLSPEKRQNLIADCETVASTLKQITNTSGTHSNNVKPILKYFISLEPTLQKTYLENLKQFATTSINATSTKQPPLFAIVNSTMSDNQKRHALFKLSQLEQMSKHDAEYFKLQCWFNTLLDIPFNKYITPSYQTLTDDKQRSGYLKSATKVLDKVIFGQRKTKNHIIEIIAKLMNSISTSHQHQNQSKSTDETVLQSGSIFAIYGEPGTGKTSLIKHGLANILKLPFVFISLGGATDAAYLNGSSYTYIGSTPGRIITALRTAQCMNPIFYFDELDKVSQTERGAEIINLLIHITDPTQNTHFIDNYLDGIELDLSRAIFVFSFNDINKVSPILRDRLTLIKFNSYSTQQKIRIAEKYLAPAIFREYLGTRFPKLKITFTPERMNRIVATGKRRGGVRYIKRRIEKLIARINVCLIKGEKRDWFSCKNGKITVK
jgi:ATP-dependent Lon protease